MIFFGLATLFIAGSTFISIQHAKNSIDQTNRANSIAIGAFELDQLTREYLETNEDRPLAQWDLKVRSLSRELNLLVAKNEEEQILITQIKSHYDQIRQDFSIISEDYSSVIGSGGRNRYRLPSVYKEDLEGTFEIDEEERIFEKKWAARERISSLSQDLSQEATQLARLIQDEAQRTQEQSNILTLLLIFILTGFILLGYVMVERPMIHAVSSVVEGTDLIGSGNLTHRISYDREDEMGTISKAINRMAERIGNEMASRVDLQTQVRIREDAEEELKQKNDELNGLNLAVTQKNQELTLVQNELNERIRELSISRRELAENEERFRVLFEQLPTGILLATPDGITTMVNPAFARMVQYPPGMIIDGHYRIFTHPDDEIVISQAIDQARQAGGAAEPCDVRLISFSGQIVWGLFRFYSFRIGDGSPDYLVVSVEDVTERKRAEEELAFLAAIIQSTDDAVIGLSLEGVITAWNDGATRLFGYPSDETIGKVIYDLIPQEQADRFRSGVESLNAGVKAASHEVNWTRRDGEEIVVSVTISLIVCCGSVKGISLISRDITRQRQMERRIIASLNEKEVLLREIHHRVKNNMQVISSLISIQSRTIADPKVKEALSDIRNRVLSISMVHEKVYQSNSLSDIRYGDYLRSVTDQLWQSFKIDPRRVTIVIDADDIVLSLDQALPCSLILNELISNSLKYAFPDNRFGVITITIRAGEGHYLIDYQDNGIGLPEDIDLQRSGKLGMQLIRSLTSQLHGEISTVSCEGACFHLSFPRVQLRTSPI